MTSYSQRKDNFLSSINEWLDIVVANAEKHHIRKIIAGILSLIWFPVIIKNLGEVFQLSYSDGKLTFFGFALTAVVYMYAFINVIYTYQKPRQKNMEANLQGSLNIDDEIFKAYRNCYDEKYDNLVRIIDKISINPCSAREEEAILFIQANNPIQSMVTLCRGIRESLYSLTPIQSKQLVVSMAYTIPSISPEWLYVDKGVINSGLDLSELSTNPKTVFCRVLSGQESDFVFENDKIEASQGRGYVFDNRDHNCGKIGSILCMDTGIKVMGLKAHLVLSVSSYGKRFCESTDENVINEVKLKIHRQILSEFAYLIRIEFASLILQKIYEESISSDDDGYSAF